MNKRFNIAQSVTKRTDECEPRLVNQVYGSEKVDRKYVYNKSDDIALGDKITVPDGAICVRIVSGYFSDGQPTEERYAEWLEPVRE